VLAGFLLKATSGLQQCFSVLGGVVTFDSLCALAVRFSTAHKETERKLFEEALAERAHAERVQPAELAPDLT
jgi:NNP family nitrate/nitrite transporter-like MFS transporter